MDVKYICIAKCPELDNDNSRHCIATKAQIQEREERLGDYCPCGNMPKWNELKCMTLTRDGQTAYELKDIEANTGISVSKLRRDIKLGRLKPGGKSFGAYFVVQSELDRYLRNLVLNRP